MWDAFYNRSSQSCTAFYKKKTDLASVEYKNYIHKDVLNYLDQYPMRQSNQKPKKGTPNARIKASSPRHVKAVKPSTAVDCRAGFSSREGPKPEKPAVITPNICKIGPLCKCAVKPQKNVVTSPNNLQLTVPPRKLQKTVVQKVSSPIKSKPVKEATRISEISQRSHLTDVDFSGSRNDGSADLSHSEATVRTDENRKSTRDSSIRGFFGITNQEDFADSCANVCPSVDEQSVSLKQYIPPWKIYKVCID